MKKILYLFVCLFLLIPSIVLGADEEKTINLEDYNTLTIEEALEEEGIDYDFKHTDTDDQVTIYLFRGKGCSHCYEFLTYVAEELMPEYGNEIKFVTFEVWNDTKNASLMTEVGKYLDVDASGVPFIVIGDKSYAGYAESMNSEIVAAIEEAKESGYDIIDSINSGAKHVTVAEIGTYVEEKAKENGYVSRSEMLIWILSSLFLGCVIIICYLNNENKKIKEEIGYLREQLEEK